jgi:nucleotide-binding universal stress UspA family protein
MRLLVAYDGSQAAQRALEHAADLVGRGATVAVVNVIPAQSLSSRLETVSDAQRDHQRQLLRQARMLLDARKIEMKPVAAVGDPTTEIRAAAEKGGADVVVVGRGRMSRRLIHGSVSTRLARRAPCDVLIIH